MNILLIEDDPDFSLATKRLLERQGHWVLTVDMLAQARSLLQDPTTKIEVVVSDSQLPDGDGPQLHAELEPLLLERNIGWVPMSGRSLKAHLDYYGQRGIPLLTKPFNDVEDLYLAVMYAQPRRS